MSTALFGADSVRAMIITILCTILIPVITVGVYKAKTKAKVTSFLTGLCFSILFSYLLVMLFNIVFLVTLGLGDALKDHPVYMTIYYSITAGVSAQIGNYFGIRYNMKKRDGRENVYMFGLGMGGLECILYGGIVNVTTLVMAIMVNNFGIDGYLKKIQVDTSQIESQRQIIQENAQIPATTIYVDGIMWLLALILQMALVIFVAKALMNKEDKKYLYIAIAVHVIGYVPTYLRQTEVVSNPYVILGTMTVYVFVVAFFAYRLFYTLPVSKDAKKLGR